MFVKGDVDIEYVGLCEDNDGGVEISQNGTVVQSVYCYDANEITFSEKARVIAAGALQCLVDILMRSSSAVVLLSRLTSRRSSQVRSYGWTAAKNCW